MFNALDYPVLMFVVLLPTFWFAAWIGNSFGKGKCAAGEDDRDEFMFVLGGTLTLLALIIAFTFSMAVTRYDQRKDYEEEEANAIGTEYVRADLLPASDAANVRNLLERYLEQRTLFYTTHDHQRLAQIETETARLQSQLWTAVKTSAEAHPTPPVTLAVWGMNDVLNRQGYTQAAWWNRIPVAAWSLMVFLAICCSLLVGYGSRRRERFLFTVLPFLVSVAFFLIADIDSPRTGVVRVAPQNL